MKREMTKSNDVRSIIRHMHTELIDIIRDNDIWVDILELVYEQVEIDSDDAKFQEFDEGCSLLADIISAKVIELSSKMDVEKIFLRYMKLRKPKMYEVRFVHKDGVNDTVIVKASNEDEADKRVRDDCEAKSIFSIVQRKSK